MGRRTQGSKGPARPYVSHEFLSKAKDAIARQLGDFSYAEPILAPEKKLWFSKQLHASITTK